MRFRRARDEEPELNLIPLIDVMLIVIHADAQSPHQSVINVMEASRQAGYRHITFATQVKSGS